MPVGAAAAAGSEKASAEPAAPPGIVRTQRRRPIGSEGCPEARAEAAFPEAEPLPPFLGGPFPGPLPGTGGGPPLPCFPAGGGPGPLPDDDGGGPGPLPDGGGGPGPFPALPWPPLGTAPWLVL